MTANKDVLIYGGDPAVSESDRNLPESLNRLTQERTDGHRGRHQTRSAWREPGA